MEQDEQAFRPALRTPRAAAIAGIVFAVLLAAALVLIRLSVPSTTTQAGSWLTDPHRRAGVAIALNLVPFAGIAFLWFIGVVRDRIGRHEDRFFATVFMGSGILFVGMLFVAGAVAGGLLVGAGSRSAIVTPDVLRLGRRVTAAILNIYAMRMAAVFMLSTATIGLRTGFVPKWLAYLGYGSALVLLVTLGITPWVALLFPVWIFILSVHILLAGLRAGRDGTVPPAA